MAADANDVLGDDYNAGAYVALCRVLLAASTSGRMEYVSPSRRLVPPTSPPQSMVGFQLLRKDNMVDVERLVFPPPHWENGLCSPPPSYG